MKKGQVTLFIIIGIIILVVFFFLFYITQRLTPGEQEMEQLTVAKSKLRSAPLRYYVESCIQKSFEEGLNMISLQGGRIFMEQPYSTLPCSADGQNSCTPASKGGSVKKIIGNKEYHVNYLITKNPNIFPQHQYPREPCVKNFSWPYCNFTYDKDAAVEPRLGWNYLPPLKASKGSIEAQLENYVAKKTNDCIDFGEITNITGIPYRIGEGDAEVDIVFTAQDTRIIVDLPLQITGAGMQTTSDVEHFELLTKMKYEYLHTFIFNLINEEIADLNFSISEDYTELDSYRQGYSLTIEKDTEARTGDDMIIISDDNIQIDGKPLKFQFVREDVPPVLNYVTDGSAPGYDAIWQFPPDPSVQTMTKTIRPGAVDMNEDEPNFIFSYRGWGRDYFEMFVAGQLKRWNPGQNEGWQFNPSNGRGSIVVNRTRDTNPPKHNFTIRVSDGQLFDQQTVRLFVVNIPGMPGAPTVPPAPAAPPASGFPSLPPPPPAPTTGSS
ncbi:hypothetical protein GF371_00355 [Candidatus Woesearchaeota archaeon]|nr:hypothetical protein [Candidatus Woesearchaeota archaeon]